jgi:plastocyanin
MPQRKFTFTIIALVVLLGVTLLPAATVTGTVKFDGPAPKMKPLKMDADPGCAKKHSNSPLAEALVLGDGQTMANVYVRIKSGLPNKTWPAPSEPVVLDQEGCQYKPHVVGVMVGQTFKVLNSDGLLHNVHALPKVNSEFNRAMPAAVKEADYKFDKEEMMFKIKCDVHPWMGAYVSVTNHPFFDVTGTDGKFKIDGLPAGTYEVEVWHERLKNKTASVTVAEGDTKSVDFSYTRPQK